MRRAWMPQPLACWPGCEADENRWVPRHAALLYRLLSNYFGMIQFVSIDVWGGCCHLSLCIKMKGVRVNTISRLMNPRDSRNQMKAFGKCVAAGAVACFLNPVHAVEQHWHLTATVNSVTAAGAVGSFAASIGRKIDVDYFIDSTNGRVSSIYFNNELTGLDSMNNGNQVKSFNSIVTGINSYPQAAHQRQDGVTLVSFYNENSSSSNGSVGAILAELSAAAGSLNEKIRFDSSAGTLFTANVTSFAVSTVPEPSAAMLALLGASAVFAGKRRVKKKSQTA